MPNLTDKIILITGAAGAVGSAVAAGVRAAGAIAITTDLKGADMALDVTLESDWQHVVAEVQAKHGRLDGLVNSAGIVTVGSIEKLDFTTWKRAISINLDGTFLGCKYAFPLLKERGGSIVNLSSVSGLVGGHNLAAYNASKGGVSLLTKSVALLGARNKPPIRCNAVCPAFLEGPMVDDIAKTARDPNSAMEKMSAEIPLQRMGKPGEVAALCLYLLSDEAAFITGADVPIDGGLTAR